MQYGPIVTWRNGDPIAPVPNSDAAAEAVEDDSVAPGTAPLPPRWFSRPYGQ